jgi:uncharacterized protein (TIGR02265 family)
VSGVRPPRFHDPVDLEAHLALVPRGATNRGIFLQEFVHRVRAVAPEVDLAALAGIERRRYLPFLQYPYADFLRLAYAAARVLFPRTPIGEGLRRLGHGTYDTLLDSQAGRAIFSALGIDFEQICRNAGTAYRMALNFGKMTPTQVGPKHFRIVYDEQPSFLETLQVGVIEGAARHCYVTPRIQIELRDLAHATIDVDWS